MLYLVCLVNIHFSREMPAKESGLFDLPLENQIVATDSAVVIY